MTHDEGTRSLSEIKTMIKNLIAIFILHSFPSISSAEVIFGKMLERSIPEPKSDINYDDVRNKKQLQIDQVVSLGDSYLKKEFGSNFKPNILDVGLTVVRVNDKQVWCWSIAYQHPDTELDYSRYFRIYLSTEGVPLMKATRKSEVLKPINQ